MNIPSNISVCFREDGSRCDEGEAFHDRIQYIRLLEYQLLQNIANQVTLERDRLISRNEHLLECLDRIGACKVCKGYGLDPDAGTDMNPEIKCSHCNGNGLEE